MTVFKYEVIVSFVLFSIFCEIMWCCFAIISMENCARQNGCAFREPILFAFRVSAVGRTVVLNAFRCLKAFVCCVCHVLGFLQVQKKRKDIATKKSLAGMGIGGMGPAVDTIFGCRRSGRHTGDLVRLCWLEGAFIFALRFRPKYRLL